MNNIDDLKRRLKRTGSQKKRRRIIEEFDTNLLEHELDQKRFEALKEKSKQKMSKLKLITLIGIYIYIPCWFICFISLGWVMSDNFKITFLNFILVMIIYLAALWDLVALFIIPLLLIILLVVRRKPGYYLNIKNI